MAQTKRKRRTKHRGNAAGYVEARGRTGRKPRADEIKKSSATAGPRDRKPPSWSSALAKAAFGAVMLFVLMKVGIFGNEQPTDRVIAMCLFAMAFYVPIMYLTDRWTYNRWLQRQKKA